MPYSEYRPELMGSATLTPSGRIEAGSWQEFTLVYTAGTFGLDDTGSLKIAFRFATDFGPVQFDDPKASGYTTVEASNGAVLDVRWEFKRNIRPWSRALYIGIQKHFLAEGDTITIRFGDRRQGSRGVRVQTYCEAQFEFKVFVDAIATYDYVTLPESPAINIVPGPPTTWRAVLPTLVRTGEPFHLSVKADDKWGNPSDQIEQTLTLESIGEISGLPQNAEFMAGQRAHLVDGLSLASPGTATIIVRDHRGEELCRTNPVRAEAMAEGRPLHFWGDLHGQSNETLGTNDARAYFEFARDCAFVDVCAHQGNDFQMTQAFWKDLNALTAELNVPGRFVTFPGYEWSSNTAVGGDRNVFYPEEGRPMYRSSHAQIPDLSDEETDAHDAHELFEKLRNEDCVVWSHCGGRYADICFAHDGTKEMAVEVHSSWGTFEWLLFDAFSKEYRIGVVCNSDGHKGRPGASYPGASFFGAYGGLTCYLAPELTRAAIMETMRRRHHYGTTGCRTYLDMNATLPGGSHIFLRDPNVFADAVSQEMGRAIMGDICSVTGDEIEIAIEAEGASPIVQLDLFDGPRHLECVRFGDRTATSCRVRLTFEGAEYRGRSRNTRWDGTLKANGTAITDVAMFNNWNLDRGIRDWSADHVTWRAVTTGNTCGFDLWLDTAQSGTLDVETPLGKVHVDLDTLDEHPQQHDFGGLGRAVTLERLPETFEGGPIAYRQTVPIAQRGDTRIWARLIHEDGHRVWSSPMYVYRA
ncbi:MAG: DUF3604 domain-containing protein [Pseudomonadota bacterium]